MGMLSYGQRSKCADMQNSYELLQYSEVEI